MTASAAPFVVDAGDAQLKLDPRAGGRISSLEIGDDELLVTSSPEGPVYWGCYPMAPWAGRIREGRFRFRGHDLELPLGAPPHAIHGIAYDRPWDVVDGTTIALELGPPWPFRGDLVQRFELTPDRLDLTLELRATEAMPAVLGWHPWFRRTIGVAAVELAFRPDAMLTRDATGLPTGELVDPSAGPWDDAFTGVRRPVRLTWPGRLALEIDSTCDWWVAYTERPDAVCIEPQSAPPDAVNLAGRAPRGIDLGPAVLEAGQVLRHSMTWRWTRLARDAEPDRA
ncbi:MAG: aldose 1-epimerase [Candidatus Limnocylindrales bacterium]